MDREIYDILNSRNPTEYFVLPLLKLNRTSFMESNFVEAYVATDLKHVYVKVLDTELMLHVYQRHPWYEGIWQDAGNYTYIRYSVSPAWMDDLIRFSKGQYTRFSTIAKSYIRRYSGLLYDSMVVGDYPRTDIRILAIEQAENLREAIEEYLGLDDGQLNGQEWIIPPKPEAFIDSTQMVKMV